MYIHSNLDYKKNIYIHLMCLISLVFYGVYKNGYLLYQKSLINVYEIFKPIYLFIIALIIYEFISLIRVKKVRIDNDLISFLIISVILPPNINYILYSFGIFISVVINEIIKDRFAYNKIALGKLIIILICLSFSSYTYSNLLELNYNYSFNIVDYIFGREVGGISSTSIVLIIISFIILSFSAVYKRIIPVICLIIYIIGCLLYIFIKNPIDMSVFMNADVFFAFVFVAPEAKSSPFSFKKRIIYGIIIGMLTLIFSSLINVYEGVYIAILITSLLFNFLNKNKNIGNFNKIGYNI